MNLALAYCTRKEIIQINFCNIQPYLFIIKPGQLQQIPHQKSHTVCFAVDNAQELLRQIFFLHSTFHQDVPSAEYDIVINPQMAFGTGHHETTSLILAELLDTDLKGKSVLDMGCGTSILAILAAKRGAGPLTAIDIDDWCVNNSRDNIALNHVEGITVELGDASLLEGRAPFDVIIANINRNILLADMERYAACMHPGSLIFMSGFYVEDVPAIRAEGERLGMEFIHCKEKHNWAAVKLCMK